MIGEDVTVTSNSTQTPCDLSPLPLNDEMQPQAIHQNPAHCIASFAAMDQMRQSSQVILVSSSSSSVSCLIRLVCFFRSSQTAKCIFN